MNSSDLVPPELLPWTMFLSANIVVQIVMIGLSIASLATWSVAIAAMLELQWQKRALLDDMDRLARAQSLGDILTLVKPHGQVWEFAFAASTELYTSWKVRSDRDGIRERIGIQLDRLEAAAARGVSRGIGLIASIGSTAPFIGLFGTVWGIMNSFIGISKSHTTNLAVVAPGIAEALLATAMGLVAAIPAVLLYNVLVRRISGYKALVQDGVAIVQRLLSADISHDRAPNDAHLASAE